MKSSLGINFIFHTIALGGGMERYTLDLLKHFSNQGYRIRIIARKVKCQDILDLSNIELIHLPDKTPLNRLNNYLFENKSDKRLTKLTHATKSKEKVLIQFEGKNTTFAEKIIIEHKNIKLKIELNQISN